MFSTFVIFDIIAMVVSSYVFINCMRKVHESSLYVYIALIVVFYVSPLFIDYLFAFPEYKYYGFYVSHLDNDTRIVFDLCIVFCLLFLYSRKKNVLKNKSERINVKHKWTWMGCVIAPLFAVFLVRNPYLLFSFQWREIGLFDLTGSRIYLITESLTYIGISTSCFLLLDSNKTFSYPLIGRLIAAVFLYMNICVEGKRAALFFALFVVVIILSFKYVDLKRRLKVKGETLSFKLIVAWITGVIAVFAAIYIMYQFSIDVKIERGYTDDPQVMVTAFRIDAFRDDRVRMAIYSQLYPDKMSILNIPGQTILTSFKYIVPINFISSRLGLSNYMYQHYFTAALDHAQLSKSCYMTVNIFAEMISNFGIILGLFAFIYLVLFFVKITDKSPQPFNILFICCFIMINLFDLSYCMYFIEFCAVMYYFNIKNKKIRNESTVVFKH